MSIENPYGLSVGWKIDPDSRYDRKPSEVTTRQMTAEERQKYSGVKGQHIGPVISYIKSEKSKQIREREKGEKDMSEKKITKERLTELCKEHGFGKEAYKVIAGILEVTPHTIECSVSRMGIRKELEPDYSSHAGRKNNSVKRAEAVKMVKQAVAEEVAEENKLAAESAEKLQSDINSHEEYVETIEVDGKTIPMITLGTTQVGHFVGSYINQPLPIETEEYPEGMKNFIQTLKDKADIKQDVDEMMEMVPDMINHPTHYTTGNIEVIDYLQDKMPPEMFEGFCVGNALKYLSRYRMKGGTSDLKKAQWYLDRIIKVKETA